MSFWTHINGVITLDVAGRTQVEMDYIIGSILDHLPKVTGSERDMEFYLTPVKGSNCSCSCDEYEQDSNLLPSKYGGKFGWLETQSVYLLTVHGSLRDRMFEETFKEFLNFATRLAKRCMVTDILVSVTGYSEKGYGFKTSIISDYKPFSDMYEYPSWSIGNETGEPAWWEHLMWDRFGNSALPLNLIVKYYKDEKADAEWDKRMKANNSEDDTEDTEQ